MEKVYVTWRQVDTYLNKIIKDLKYKPFYPVGVYGIPRGGNVLATMLSYRMNIPLLAAPAKNCIIIDDICDSGRSLLHYTKNDTQFNNYYITTMYYHIRSAVTPNFYAYNKQDKWIVFPWEKGEENV